MSRDEPDYVTMSGWQRTDADHMPGTGAAAYRIVYKTLKTFLPEIDMRWPNLLMRCGHGDVDRGGVRLDGALSGRRDHRWMLPQSGSVAVRGETLTFHPSETRNFEFHAWQESIESAFFVEFILHTEQQGTDRRIAEGRRRLSRVKTLIELSFGPRVLGLRLTEELGEVFPDGHFNRSLESEQIGNEWQLDLAAITASQFQAWSEDRLRAMLDRTPESTERLSLACEWYWRSTETSDPVTEYLELWFVVEAIAMPDGTDVRPVRERLASAFGGTETDWRSLVGRHFGRRSKLVHGAAPRQVEDADVEQLRVLVKALLELEMGIANPERARRLRRFAGVTQ
jgi:hypothetical protein